MERSRDVLMNMAKLCVENDEVEFVGSGPAKGAAEFGMAKNGQMQFSQIQLILK